MSEPLTEAEVRDLCDSRGPMMEGIVVYGWERILTTLVLANVVRKRLLTMAEERAALTSQVHDLSLRLGVAEHELSEERIRADGAEGRAAALKVEVEAAEAAADEANRRCAQDPCVKDDHVGIDDRLDRAYAEIRKQTFASKVVFDREIVEEAEKRNPGLRPGMEDVP